MVYGSGNYKPDNELFRNIVLTVLFTVGCIMYLTKLMLFTESPTINDWLVFSFATVGAVYYSCKTGLRL